MVAPSATHLATDANAVAWSLSAWYQVKRMPTRPTAATTATAIVAPRAHDPNGWAAIHRIPASMTKVDRRLVTKAPAPPAPRVVASGTNRIATSRTATTAR